MHILAFRAAQEPVQSLAAQNSFLALWQKKGFDFKLIYHPRLP